MRMERHVSAPDSDAIAKLAYQLWEERGRPLGSAEGDWYEAERQLLQLQSGAIGLAPTARPRGPRQTRTGARTKRRSSA
jgi:Protein of unknown function (DUF2934)